MEEAKKEQQTGETTEPELTSEELDEVAGGANDFYFKPVSSPSDASLGNFERKAGELIPAVQFPLPKSK